MADDFWEEHKPRQMMDVLSDTGSAQPPHQRRAYGTLTEGQGLIEGSAFSNSPRDQPMEPPQWSQPRSAVSAYYSLKRLPPVSAAAMVSRSADRRSRNSGRCRIIKGRS